MKTPTLITFGELDGPEQAEEMYRTLAWRGVPVELLIYPGEGHVFRKPSQKRTKLVTELSWLERHLLGRPSVENRRRAVTNRTRAGHSPGTVGGPRCS